MTVLRYGADASVELRFDERVQLAELGTPPGQPLEDLTAAVLEALERPAEYPPLRRCTTPGDRVVVVLDHGIPQVAQITAAVVNALVDAPVDPDGISVLLSRADINAGVENPCRLIPDPIRRRLKVAIHNPADRRMLAYLAASESGEPILLHRAIHDADLVLPIGCLYGESTAGYYGIHTSIFPTFSDDKTLTRFRSIAALRTDRDRKAPLTEEVEQVAWLLGINFTIQLVPAGGDRILHVVAGQSEAVSRLGRQLFDAAWHRSAPRRAGLVVATIEGNSNQQTWRNVGRALDTAVDLVEDNGAIAVCCDLAAAPGPAMQRLAGGSESREQALRQIRKDRPEDALPAAQLAQALDRARVYLLSRLEPPVVEELEMIHVASGEELARLVGRHESCTLLSNAQYSMFDPLA